MMNSKRFNLNIRDIVPVVAFLIVLVFFTIISKGRTLAPYNIKLVLDQTIICIVAGCGSLFVVAQGSIDLSVGVTFALSGVVATFVSIISGIAWLFFPCAIVVGGLIGLFSGVVLSKFKVPSFMITVSLLISLRGFVNYLQSLFGVQVLPPQIAALNHPYILYPAFAVVLALLAYSFEFTKLGKYSKLIGENETTAEYIGIPIVKMKIVVFVISGITAAIAAMISLIQQIGTSVTEGVFFEMKVCMAIFLGGVLVTGGSSAKIFKVIIGSFTITLITNGLALIGQSSNQVTESVEGVLLLLILFVTVYLSEHYRGHKTNTDNEINKE